MLTFIDSNVLIAAATGKGKHMFGLNMADALHIAAAIGMSAEEFVTAERPASPLKNVVGIKIVSIYTP